ncbi:MAG: tRNA epoxyqueuosine(34) reductase QueG [Phycisphaerae bacterium]|nr:tRNA epoxyqueuosine(34) reductase QueG [Phycisphaerae bacterium]
MNPSERTTLLKRLALDEGFDEVGVAAAAPLGRSAFLQEWLERGFAGSMDYLHRNAETRSNPTAMLAGARSIIVVALQYAQPSPPGPEDSRPRGRIARYAWGQDYHDVLRDKLRQLVARLREALPEAFDSRICVDTAPILERELATAAGIGWIGKNTLVLNAKRGSYFFLGELITTLEFTPDAPANDHCGSCTRCLDACPTQAFVEPHVMDARRCIAYLTIERRDDIPAEFHAAMGNWIYGCDICQEVCPFNRKVPDTREPAFAVRPPAPSVPLDEVLGWTHETYNHILGKSAMQRASLAMFQRNARIAMTNAQGEEPGTEGAQNRAPASDNHHGDPMADTPAP